MSNKRNKLNVLIIFCVVVLLAEQGLSLIEVGGSDPIADHGWPIGSVQLANLPTRVSWWAGPPFGTGSMYEFQYNCESTAQFNEALAAFAAITADRLELVVHNGPKIDWLNREQQKRIDWTFTIWNPKDWDQLNNTSRAVYRLPDSGTQKPVPRVKKPVPAPRVDVYIGGDCPIVWKDVKMPKKLTIIDKRPGSADVKLSDKGLIKGRVFDIETKKPIAGATIILLGQVESKEENEGGGRAVNRGDSEWKKTTEVTTNSGGNCQFSRIPLGLYKVRLFAEDYAPVEIEIYDNRRPEIYEFEAGLMRTGFIKGIVVDTGGRPLGGVAVSVNDFVGTDGNEYPFLTESPIVTDEQGRFQIEGLPKGFASVRCQGKGLHQKGSIFEMYPIPLGKLKLTMEGTGIVRGKVLTKKGSIPAGQIVLELEPPGEEKIGKWGYSGYLSKDGTFNISGIPPGEYIITTRPNPSSADYKPNEKKIVIEPGKTYEIEILHVE